MDDESPEVQREITKHLLAFGPQLREELAKLSPSLIKSKEDFLIPILESQQRTWLRQNWANWFEKGANLDKLETAFSLLSEFQCGWNSRYNQNLKKLLDTLAFEYQSLYPHHNDEKQLAEFLFKIKKVKGAQEDYYNPQNSNLAYVIIEKRGLPISLTSIYMLVGGRLGLTIGGYNFPGHFMAYFKTQGKGILVDCFNEGRMIEENDVIHFNVKDSQNDTEYVTSQAETIIQRVLSNLVQAFQVKGNLINKQCMLDLYEEMEARFLQAKEK